jgi:hypothetical protein
VGIKKFAPAVLVVMAFVAMAAAGCGADDREYASTGSTQTAASSSGAGGAGGSGGDGGGGGGTALDNGRTATEMVSAGEVSKSANFTMVHTLGQPTQNQGKSISSSYRLQGGLNGANGSLP